MEAAVLTSCPSCGTKLSDSIFSSNKLFDNDSARIRLIKEYNPNAQESYCSRCSAEPFKNSTKEYEKETKSLNGRIQQLINDIIVVSVQSPLNWDYEVLRMVTGQSTTGTGIFSEFKSSITDFFGAQSGTYNKKILHGEELCQVQMRLKCLEAGGNAIIAADIDYAEVGGAQGMLMVCMTGTAVKLKNPHILGNEKGNRLTELERLFKRKSYLEPLTPYINL